MIARLLLPFFTFVSLAHADPTAFPQTPISRIVEFIGLRPYLYDDKVIEAPKTKIKVAVFDQGFAGFKPGDKTLPSHTVLIPNKYRPPSDDDHGYLMAQAYYQVLTDNLERKHFEPELYLYPIEGLSALEDAVDDAIAKGVKLVIYPQVFDTGGNFDGKGPFNEVMNKLVNAGIIWVNSAGNYRGSVYNGPVQGSTRGRDGFAVSQAEADRLSGWQKARERKNGETDVTEDPDIKWAPLVGYANTLTAECRPTKESGDSCEVDVSLVWNDVREGGGTNKDLDLYVFQGLNAEEELEDSQVRSLFNSLYNFKGPVSQRPGLLYRSENQQIEGPRNERQQSRWPWETLDKKKVKKGRFYIRVKVTSPDNFTVNDKLRVSIMSTDAVRLADGEFDPKESLQVLADHEGAITTGALNPRGPEATSSISVKKGKPEVWVPGVLPLDSETRLVGNSVSAAVMGAGLTPMLSLKPTLTRGDTLKWLGYEKPKDRSVNQTVMRLPHPVDFQSGKFPQRL